MVYSPGHGPTDCRTERNMQASLQPLPLLTGRPDGDYLRHCDGEIDCMAHSFRVTKERWLVKPPLLVSIHQECRWMFYLNNKASYNSHNSFPCWIRTFLKEEIIIYWSNPSRRTSKDVSSIKRHYSSRKKRLKRWRHDITAINAKPTRVQVWSGVRGCYWCWQCRNLTSVL